MSELDDLIARLERASGPDRELDEAIALSVGLKISSITTAYGRAFENRDGVFIGACPRYSESIDAAMTLLEPGWEYTISTLYGFADVDLPLNDTTVDPVHVRRKDSNVPMAICEAVLRTSTSRKAEG